MDKEKPVAARCEHRVENEKWHARTIEETLSYLRTDAEEGLSVQEARSRLLQYGHNEMLETKKPGWWQMVLAQFRDFMVLVLLGATLISGLLGEYADAATILIIVMINAVLGFLQEYRAEQSLQALRKISAATARVVRNGNSQQLSARELVPGDIMLLEAGDKPAADGRIIAAYSMEAEESALTGESMPVKKTGVTLFPDNSPLGDRKNMVYAGTIISRGRGRAVVCDTGMLTEMGYIAGMIQAVATESTPLERRLEHLGRLLVWSCLLICLIVVITGIIKGEPLLLMCMAGISLAVAAIPEGLPAIVTVALALGVQRMIKRNAIIRKMAAVETLGCTTVICSDKTGTLTRNEMTVQKIFADRQLYAVTGEGYELKGDFLANQHVVTPNQHKTLQQTLVIGALCNNSLLKNRNIGISGIWRRNHKTWSIEGDPTEGALLIAAAKADIWRTQIEKKQARLAELPFDSERRRMSVVYRNANGCTLYSKGAPDTLLELCSHTLLAGKEVPLSGELKSEILAANDALALQSLRVVASAYRKLPGDRVQREVDESMEANLVFTGLFGMVDPPRPEARTALTVCRHAGIKTVMITGDHPNTALAIARDLQICEHADELLTGKELDDMDEQQLIGCALRINVYARVSPVHKLRIVKALKQCGYIVSMTGDGINDAPAIKEAHIGIAMGITGTDVAKEASAMILVDDNFATIVAAVEEGRGIYDNIRKFIRYLLSCNFGEVLTMFIATLLGMPLPLLPVQILWVNLVTDGLPAMALGVDPNESYIMQRPPRSPGESIFSRGLSRKIVGRGIQIAISTLSIFAFIYFVNYDVALARTMAFSTLVFSQLFHVFDCRSEIHTVFEAGVVKNKYLLAAVLCSVIMQLAVIYIPPLQAIFQTVPLSLSDWGLIIGISGCTCIVSGLKYLASGSRVKRSVYSRS